MLAGEFFDLLDEQLRKLVRRYGRGPENTHRGAPLCEVPPFGGVQLICCGDFFQLPPIVTKVCRLHTCRLDTCRLDTCRLDTCVFCLFWQVPLETWSRLDARALKEHRAVLASGLDGRCEEHGPPRTPWARYPPTPFPPPTAGAPSSSSTAASPSSRRRGGRRA